MRNKCVQMSLEDIYNDVSKSMEDPTCGGTAAASCRRRSKSSRCSSPKVPR